MQNSKDTKKHLPKIDFCNIMKVFNFWSIKCILAK